MKTSRALLVLAVVAAAGSIYADKVPLQQIPLAAQEAIRSHSGRNPIIEVDRFQRGDQITYEAVWKSGGSKQALLVSEAGVILRDVLGPSAGPTTLTLANKSAIALTDAPLPVQRTIREQVRGAGIESVEKGIWNGQIIYQAAFTKGGERILVQVGENGDQLTPKTATPAFQAKYGGLAQGNVPMESAAKMLYLYAPDPVKKTIDNFAEGSSIDDFQRGLWNGKSIFEARFIKNGERIDLQVLEDGSLLTRPPAGQAIGAPPAFTTGTGQAPPIGTGQQQP